MIIRSVPKSLFHYTGITGLLGILKSQTIWASNIHYLNDSKEFHQAIDYAKTLLSREIKNEGLDDIRDELNKCVSNRFEQIEHISILVASFSEAGDILSQWRSYCPAGAGYSIGFDYNKLSSLAFKQGFQLKPCIYKPEQHSNLIRPLILQFLQTARDLQEDLKNQNGHVLDSALDVLVENFIQLAPTMKHLSFAEEREWRLISKPFPSNHPTWDVRAGKNMLIPYATFSLETNLTNVIREVIVGPTPHQYLASSSLSSALNKYGIEKWSVTLSNTSFRDW